MERPPARRILSYQRPGVPPRRAEDRLWQWKLIAAVAVLVAIVAAWIWFATTLEMPVPH